MALCKLLLIALLFSFNCFGQYPMTKLLQKKASSCAYLLDTYTGAVAAYSLRKLDADYAGSAIRVRRSSDNTEQDIGFVGCGDLDTASMKTFVGTGGTDDGFVVTIYNQGTGGSNHDATQSTSANQAMVMDNGVVLRQGARPAIYFDGSNDYYTLSTGVSGAYPYSCFTAHRKPAGGAYGLWMSPTSGSPHTQIIYGATTYIANTSSTYAYVSYSTDNYVLMSGFTTGASTYSLYTNGSSQSLSTAAGSGTSLMTRLGYRSGGEYTFGYMTEFIIYNSDETANRTGIESNMNTFYTIY